MATPTITALTLYGQPGASTTLATAAAMVAADGATGTSAHSSLVGTSTGYGELTGLGTGSAWAAAGALGAQSGQGFLWDAITLERQVLQGGAYRPTVRLSASVGSVTADILCRYSIRHSDGSYTTLATAILTAQAITTTWTSYDLPGAAGLPAFCGAGDKLYCDLWLNISTNSTGSGAATISIGDLGNGGLGAGGNQWRTPGFAVPMPSGVQWRIQIRNHALTPVGELARGDLFDGDLVGNFNDVGAFALTINADSPMAQYFTPGNGVIISRDRGDGSGSIPQFSGPIWHLERHLQDNTWILAGPSDEWWLKKRRAEPVTVAGNYSAAVNAQPTLVRYYRLGEASGTNAVDSKSGATGTYSATGVTYGVAPGIDDANTAVTLNGTSGRISIPATGLPTGNAPWCLAAWVKLASTPAANAYIVGYGASATGQNPLMYVNTSRQFVVTGFAWGDTTSSAVNVGDWHFIAVTWDGTNLTGYLDGLSFGSHAPGAMTIPASGLSGAIGSNNAGSGNFFPGSIDEVVIRSGALSAASIQALYAAGISRYAQSAYDTLSNTASTVIRHYVDANAGPGALVARRVTGLALAADPAIGSVVTGNVRFDNLLAAIQALAIAGGDIGFRLIQTDVGVLTFTIYQPATQSNAIFSRELGNLLDATYTLDGPTGNQYVIGGSGEGTLRIFQTSQDSASVTTWGMTEGDFQDARDTADIPTLQQRLAAQLAQDAEQTNLTITPVDTPALQYGRDYGLGDIVTVQIDGQTITDKIRQIHIQLNSSDQELVTPGIGNPSSGQVAHLFDARARTLARVQQMVARLQATQ